MMEHPDQIVSVVVIPVFTLVLGALIWFLKRTMETIDAVTKMTQEMSTTTKLLEQRLETIQRDVASALLLAQRLTEFESKLAVLERNLQTAFGKIDENRDHGEVLRKRSHHFQNKLLVLKSAIESTTDDLDLGPDWAMPA